MVTGCGDKKLDKPLPSAGQKLVVEGPWKDGGRIPKQYTCDGAQKAPEVGASEPAGTKDVAFVMTDPDAPGGTFVHWTHWGSNTEGENSFGKTRYGGPCPPKGDKPHRYVITFYALRAPLGLPAGSDPDKVVAAIKQKAFASGSLTGLYGR
ncbi:MAG TPA: YbhB/YbcL family Raf kinase inhibitor-like protein [Thermoleophilaceae bacterium]